MEQLSLIYDVSQEPASWSHFFAVWIFGLLMVFVFGCFIVASSDPGSRAHTGYWRPRVMVVVTLAGLLSYSVYQAVARRTCQTRATEAAEITEGKVSEVRLSIKSPEVISFRVGHRLFQRGGALQGCGLTPTFLESVAVSDGQNLRIAHDDDLIVKVWRGKVP